MLADLRVLWFFCGGWAIDLFLNRVTRAHKDVDVAVVREDQQAVQAYLTERGWTLRKAVDGAPVPWQEGEQIAPPVHVIWCNHGSFQPDFLELLFNEADSAQFTFRRNRSITRERARMALRSAAGWPILAPEIVLLYKANRPDDEDSLTDFLQTVPHLAPEQRAWLRGALAVLNSEHPWLLRF